MNAPRRAGGRGPVDWAAVRERMLRLQASLAGETGLSPAQTAAVLAERARALARPVAEAPDEEILQLVELELGGERYAIETRFVVEVVGHPEIAYLPGVEPPLVGSAAWRGELLPLLDLASALGLPGGSAADSARLVVLGDARASFAILVGTVLELRELPASALRPLPGGATAGGSFLRGSTGDAVVVLDAADLIHSQSSGERS